MFYIRYLGAQMYDGMILVALFFTFTAACIMARHGVAIPAQSFWYQLALLTITYGYYALSCQYGGQTIGMRAWHIKLVSLNGRLSQKQLLGRFFLTIPAGIYAVIRFKSPLKIVQHWTKSQVITSISG